MVAYLVAIFISIVTGYVFNLFILEASSVFGFLLVGVVSLTAFSWFFGRLDPKEFVCCFLVVMVAIICLGVVSRDFTYRTSCVLLGALFSIVASPLLAKKMLGMLGSNYKTSPPNELARSNTANWLAPLEPDPIDEDKRKPDDEDTAA